MSFHEQAVLRLGGSNELNRFQKVLNYFKSVLMSDEVSWALVDVFK